MIGTSLPTTDVTANGSTTMPKFSSVNKLANTGKVNIPPQQEVKSDHNDTNLNWNRKKRVWNIIS